jgi:ketosteroid isomerase-like protein
MAAPDGEEESMTARRKARAKAARSRKKSGGKAARRKPAGRKAAGGRRPRAKAARKAAKRPVGPSPTEALARKIVKASSDPSFPFEQLYTEDCVSTEATGESFHGHAGLAQKMRNWESMQQRSTWRARNVLVRGNVICIEWEATVELRDGRTVTMQEVAVHEVRGGKIGAERYYYNPLALAPPTAAPAL